MKKHTKIYFNHFDYCEQDVILCEVCKAKAVDIHHIDNKGMGGSKNKDYIENLIALCRSCHEKAHAHVLSVDYLRELHASTMNE